MKVHEGRPDARDNGSKVCASLRARGFQDCFLLDSGWLGATVCDGWAHWEWHAIAGARYRLHLAH